MQSPKPRLPWAELRADGAEESSPAAKLDSGCGMPVRLVGVPFIFELGGVDAHAFFRVIDATDLRVKPLDRGRPAAALPRAQRGWRLHDKKDRE
ncbi:hypothetical protein D3C80_1915020 [compost metagenome]